MGDNEGDELLPYNERLKRDRNYINPYAVEHMRVAFSVEELGTMLKQPPYLHRKLSIVVIRLDLFAFRHGLETSLMVIMRSYGHGKIQSGQTKRTFHPMSRPSAVNCSILCQR